MQPHPSGGSAPASRVIYRTLCGVILLCLLPEICIQMAPIWGNTPDRLRRGFESYSAFWPGLLRDWRPNYPLQSLTMFISYSFLHTGLWHLGFNMLTLWSLGFLVIEGSGPKRFMLIYATSAIGGAVGYTVLTQSPYPMVGASGALFGLAGALIWLGWQDPRNAEFRWSMLTWQSFVLIAMNVVMYWAMDGRLAWQTHLGGCLAGAGVMAILTRLEKRSLN